MSWQPFRRFRYGPWESDEISLNVAPEPVTHSGLEAFFGHPEGVALVIVSDHDVEIPVNAALGWGAAEIASLLCEIDDLPETIERSPA